MKVYLDTGIFYDYLIYRSIIGDYVRSKGRRNRSINQLRNDVEICLQKLKSDTHNAYTSSITFLEVEESIYKRLQRNLPSVPDRCRFLIMSARPMILQVTTICEQYGIEIINLSLDIAKKSVENSQLQSLGIRAGDTIHLVSAINYNADLIISTDIHMLRLNEQIQNLNNNQIKCLDTCDAKDLL